MTDRRAHLADRDLYRKFYAADLPQRNADSEAGQVLPPNEPRLQWAQQNIGIDDDVVDIGCYDGPMTFSIRRWTTGRVVGIDLQEMCLHRGRRKAQDEKVAVEFVKSWAEELPFPDDSFDVAVLCEILEHVASPAAVIKEAERIVKPGGSVVVSVPVNALEMERLSPDNNFFVGADGQHFDLDGHVNEYLPQVELRDRTDFRYRMANVKLRDNLLQWRMCAYRV